jgi:dephospho-CoA kinase
VDCPEAVQLARVKARDGETEDSARAILAAQASRAQRLAAADDVIVNDGEEAGLGPQVAALDARYRALVANRAG